ncbi:basic secretory protein-like protein [Pedobacter sp. UBA5917]|jgi:hypothetical protein|uniref:basic secretory protein-like protein n=1 Tax=Pedobacter sp. UBA5917 TaxID=1947061 RepID=UPI0025F2BB89|nr:basic secretory protein-like protein [Pedobacter sp. UBA5917]
MKLLNKTTLFAYVFLGTSVFLSSCKKDHTDTENPEPRAATNVTARTEVTGQAQFTVSTENTGGKDAAEGSSKVIDNNIETKFLIFSHQSSFYMQFEFPTNTQVAAYTLTSANDASERDPSNWTITASTNGTTWTELDHREYEMFPLRKQGKTYNFVNNNAYKFYRINVKVLFGQTNPIFQLAEIKLFSVPQNQQTVAPNNTLQTVVEGANTLIFTDKTGTFSAATKAGFITVFKANYQRMANTFNIDAPKTQVFVIDSAYQGVAATYGGSVIRYDPRYFANNPKDIDVVTHEMMHVVQSYKFNLPNTGWITEGIADYVRYIFGYDNAGANWSLPAYNSNQNYTDAYRVTARFFAWLENHGYQGIVIKLDKAMRDGTYNVNTFWSTNANGKTVDQLWQDYKTNPAL